MSSKDFTGALRYSLLLLKYRARSSQELRGRLGERGYNRPTVEKTLSFLAQKKFIDDASFAEAFVAYASQKGWGPRRIGYRLEKLGIPQALRVKALARYPQQERLRDLISTYHERYRKGNDDSPKIWQKIARVLAAKGFEYHEIFQAFDKLGVQSFEDS